MRAHVEAVLIDQQRIALRIAQMAQQITRDLQAAAAPDPPQLTIVPILTGSLIFVADLIRQLPLQMRISLLSVSSYPGAATTTQGPTLRDALCDLPEDLAGQHVLIVDDIFDSGKTLELVTDLVRDRQPASLHTCVLLRKEGRAQVQMALDYVAFEIPDAFVVGYGLDYDGYYRNLPEIVTLRPEAVDPQGGQP